MQDSQTRTRAKVHPLLDSITLYQASSSEGDSGGPLLIPNSFGGIIAAGNPELDLLVGVTSMGSEDCTDTSPTIYTSIGAFWDWILWRIGEGPEVNSFALEQEKERQVPVDRPSPDKEKSVKTPKKRRPANGTTRKEQLKQQKIEEERKRSTKLSQKELIKVAFDNKDRCPWTDGSVGCVSLHKG